jgi:release factor glutamine methyltransferase
VSEAWTTLKVLDWTAGRFERAGLASSRLDAQVLLAHVLACERVALYTDFERPLAPEELGKYRELIQRRLAGEPVAYLTGHQEFWSLDFAVDSRVLIPRPDTETLVQLALELGDTWIQNQGDSAIAPLSVMEVATGSGAVAIAIAHERVEWQVSATDLSEDALTMARGNAERNNLEGRIDFRSGDLLAPLGNETFGLLVANLPYISRKDMETLPPEVQHEPTSALCGGETGLELIETLIAGVEKNLRPGAWVALEHGFEQGERVRSLAETAGFSDVQTREDLAGRARVTYFQRG